MGREQSECLILPSKSGNLPQRDPAEGRGHQWCELQEGKMAGAPIPETISTRRQQIAERARATRGSAIHTLARFMDEVWLHEAYRLTRKDGAVGIDGETAEAYAVDLAANLRQLEARAKSGTYRAPPVRRTFIPKADGKLRPLGIPTFEDKVLQRAVLMLLEPIYEEEFYDFSYGFRPGRSARDALQALNQHLYRMGGGWVLEVDIRSFFDTLDHAKLREMLNARVTDGVVARLVSKWLHAGVMTDGRVERSVVGTPQGGVISPLLANIYLHEVLDTWWVRDVVPRLAGESHLIRYADDFVMIFAEERDARRVLDVLPKRLGRFGLALHEGKTRLLWHGKPRTTPVPGGRVDPPESFDFLGFTHFWARSRRGFWIPRRRTAKDRFARGLARIKMWLQRALHIPVPQQARGLGQRVRGHYQYFDAIGNRTLLWRFKKEVERLWRKALSRRSQRGAVGWDEMRAILQRHPLPRPPEPQPT